MKNKKPNIIHFHCESMDGRKMGCMGNSAMESATPNLDNLAKNGVLFQNAYTNSPICCPSRASMWSGQFPHNCEAWNNNKGLNKNDPTFLTQFKDNGYITKEIGPVDYISGTHTIRSRVLAWTRAAEIKRPGYNVPPPRIIENQEDIFTPFKKDEKNIEQAINWLEKTKSKKDPFMLYLTTSLVHHPFQIEQKYLDLIDKQKIDIPPYDNINHPVLNYQKIVKNWRHGFSKGVMKSVRHIYLAMIAKIDILFGKLMKAVKELGLNQNTYIIFTSDHGELAMEHQQIAKSNHYEPSIHIPLIISGPEIKKNKKYDDLVSLIDIYPTLMDIADIKKPNDLDGYSLMPLCKENKSEHPDWILSQYHAGNSNTGSFMVRQGKWKYINYVGYEPLLFNLEQDPYEVNNLAQHNQGKLKEMEQLLMDIVDYEKIDKKAKAYDKYRFKEWRKKQIENAEYQQNMARVYSGWDGISDDEAMFWTEEDEKDIQKWLES